MARDCLKKIRNLPMAWDALSQKRLPINRVSASEGKKGFTGPRPPAIPYLRKER